MAKSYCVVPAYRESVRLAIDKTGKSLEVLAGEIQISKPTLTSFRDGSNVSQSSFISISERLGLDWQEIAGLTTAPSPANPSLSPEPPNNIPISGVEEFIGREPALLNLHALLQSHQYVALSGMGGMGKTELGIQYALKYMHSYPGGICWINARAEDDYLKASIPAQIASFARIKKILSLPSLAIDNDLAEDCYDNWIPGNALFIFDDVESYEKIRPLLPKNSRFRVIITTRLILDSPCKSFEVKELSVDDSMCMLRVLIKDNRVSLEEEKALRICEFMGGLPLSLELAGRYLNNDLSISLSSYLVRLNNLALERQAVRDPSLQGDCLSDPSWSLTARRGLEPAFLLTWNQLDSYTQFIAKIIGSLVGNPVSWKLVDGMKQAQARMNPEFGEYDKAKLLTSRKRLIMYNLIKPVNSNETVYRLHPLTREFFRSRISNEEYLRIGNE